ncbi:hypothetical protein GUJ93_ZPchr0013g35509 [Zizania palustris]|uniref:Uncharacterized protein n=1 Tax=Zizania palustris TaxID=103762 RepID=A0A8J5WT43_ZIZPA|nr:hypothetical protein GUJ93_ZPchr0013g35509 [Zizania palustris]
MDADHPPEGHGCPGGGQPVTIDAEGTEGSSSCALDMAAAAPTPSSPRAATDDIVHSNVEAPMDALVIARSLLPTPRLSAIEYNLPVLQVQWSLENDSQNMERVDWTTLKIVETHDDEGRIELMSESQMCDLLGLAYEDTQNIPIQGLHRPMNEQDNDNELGQDVDGAAIPTNDVVPGV